MYLEIPEMLVGFAPLTLLIINLNTEKILSVDSVNSDTALQIYFNLRVRPSIQFGQPPPPLSYQFCTCPRIKLFSTKKYLFVLFQIRLA